MDSLIHYIESLTVTQGDLVNQPVTVFPMGKAIPEGRIQARCNNLRTEHRAREWEDVTRCRDCRRRP